MHSNYLLQISFIAICIATLACDLRWRKVPNWLVMTGLVLPLPWLLLEGQALNGIAAAASVAGALLGFACLLPAYALRKMGAGDVKFFAVLGFWLGPAPLVSVFVIGSLIAATQAVITLASRHPLLQSHGAPAAGPEAGNPGHLLHGWRFAGRGIPYAAWLAIGAMVWLLRHPV